MTTGVFAAQSPKSGGGLSEAEVNALIAAYAAPLAHTHAAADIISGTLDNARVNWAAPSDIGTTTRPAISATTVNATSTTLPQVTAANPTSTRSFNLRATATASSSWNFEAGNGSFFVSGVLNSVTPLIFYDNGRIGFNTGFAGQSGIDYMFKGLVATDKVIVVRGATSHSGSLQEWQNPTGTLLASVDAAGIARLAGLRLDLTPTAESLTPTHSITISVNGTNYKIPLQAA